MEIVKFILRLLFIFICIPSVVFYYTVIFIMTPIIGLESLYYWMTNKKQKITWDIIKQILSLPITIWYEFFKR